MQNDKSVSHFGRKKSTVNSAHSQHFKPLLAAGCAAVIFTLAISAKSTFGEEIAVTTSAYIGDKEAIAEPFGYFMGEWNLWEFIGDSIASLLPEA